MTYHLYITLVYIVRLKQAVVIARKDEKTFDVIRPSKELSRLIASKTRHISRMLYLSVLSAVSHHGLENEIYFKCSSLEINSFASFTFPALV